MDVLTEHFISFLNVSFLLKYNKLAKNNIKGKINVFQMLFLNKIIQIMLMNELCTHGSFNED